MCKTINPTAGSGDPYWYEWSVGLMYILDMINPDNNIKSVTFQSNKAQGLDDVIVKYKDNTTECIQIKHSRTGDTITFGDLVYASESKKSLLRTLSNAWKDANEVFGKSKAILYTNRKSSERQSTAKSKDDQKYIRPPLLDFWVKIKKQVNSINSIKEIKICDDWNIAWKIWLEELADLSDKEKLEFLKCFSIKTDQPGLEEIKNELINKIATIFCINKNKAIPILNALDSALRKWTTTLRGKVEEVNREEIFKTLSINSQELVGEHNLKPPYPFFKSRMKFLEKLESYLLNGEKKIIFLTGNPGEGKTSIVSSLANKRDSVIDLRFHAYKPITPEAPILPADAGKTTTARALWGDLLSQLRTIFKGRLSEFEVPIFNDILTTEELRSHVIRLSKINGKLKGKPTVIAIDGIDHAARAGIDNETFLNTLIPPEEVPNEIKFLIVGQPPAGYRKYPIWLRDNRDDISVWTVTGIEDKDIYDLLKVSTNLDENQLLPATNIVSQIVSGNTLSAIFAVHEAKEAENVEELQKILIDRKLHNGISSYYETIWNSALSQIKFLPPFLDMRIAGCIALTSERLKGEDLSEIFKDYGYPPSIWDDFLRSLKPLVIEEESGFRVTHNDVRVHLMRVLKTDSNQLIEVASKMADYYWKTQSKALVRHSSLFDLLELSNRACEQIKLFTSQFVMEGIALRRPLKELQEQCKKALSNMSKTADWESLHSFYLACATLNQYQKVTDLVGEKLETRAELPPFLSTEGKVLTPNSWTLDIVFSVVQDAKRLISEGELSRAKGLINRWFSDLTPCDFISIIGEENLTHGINKSFSDIAENLFVDFGIVCYHTGLLFNNTFQIENVDKLEKNCLALFYKGFISESLSLGGTLQFIRALKKAQIFYYDDLETWLITLVKNRRWHEVAFILHKIGPDDSIPISFKVTAATCSIFTGNKSLVNKWIRQIIQDEFEFLKDFNKDNYEKRTVLYAMVSLILGWSKPERESGGISQDGASQYFKDFNSERGKEHLIVILNASASVGKWIRFLVNGSSSSTNFFSVEYIIQILNALLKHRRPNERLFFNHNNLSSSLIEIIIECCKRSGKEYDYACYSFIKEYCSNNYPTNYMLNIGWNFLYKRGEKELLEKWFDYWLGPNGKAWHEEISFRLEVANIMIDLANQSEMTQQAEEALLRKNWGLISYSSHKEYILNELLTWFNELAKVKPNCWVNEGKKLLEISQEISDVGDNRMEGQLLNDLAIAIANSGPKDMWRYYHAENLKENILDNPHILIDGIIGMLQKIKLTEVDALILWSIGLGTLNWRNEIDRIYLNDLKNAIIQVSEECGIHEIANKLERLGASEYHAYGNRVKYIVPVRWYFNTSEDRDSEWLEQKEILETKNLGDAIIYIKHNLWLDSSKERLFWKSYSLICKRLLSERPEEFLLYLDQLKELISNSQIGWSVDYILTGYNSVATMLSASEKWSIMQNILNNTDLENSYWIYPLTEFLNGICLYQAKAEGIEVLQSRFNQILDTHSLWINGNGFLPKSLPIVLPEIKDYYPNSWIEFILEYYKDVLYSDNLSRIELALRGIWAILQISPDGIKEYLSKFFNADIRIKEWLLIIAERVATSLPEKFKYFSEFVRNCYESDVLNLKLQSFVVYHALNRTLGQSIPEIKFSEHSQYNLLRQLDGMGPGLLQIPSIKQGAFYTVNGSSFVRSSLTYIEEVTKENLDDIERKLNSYIKVSPKNDVNFKQVKFQSGESKLIHIPEKYKLMDVIYNEIALSRWADIPPLRFAQAITSGDDPFILLTTPTPASDLEDWPIDEILDELINKGKDHLKNHVLHNINAGVKENEIVIGAVLLTYSHGNDVRFCYNHILFNKYLINIRQGEDRVFSGRSYGFYENLRFDPRKEYYDSLDQMTYQTGGISYFTDQSFLVYPSILWSELFGWKPLKNNPRVWIHNNEVVARHDYIHGPYRELYRGGLHRQPIMQRWVCNKTVFEQTLKNKNLINLPSINIKLNEQ